MPTTANKGYEVQVTGTNVDTWGDILNDDVIDIIDSNLGGIVTKTLASSNVNLSATESEALIVRLIGTISANIAVTTLAKGMTMVENLTSGAFSVTFAFFGVGSPVTIPQGTRAVIITDGTNGARTAADNQSEFASTTSIIFCQAAAPTGWTKETGSNNAGLRLVSGTGAATGGSVDFTTAFASQTPAGSVGNTTLTVDQMPSHSHEYIPNSQIQRDGTGSSSGSFVMMADGNNTATLASVISSIATTGGGQSHNHTFTGSAINLAVKYVDVIRCTKN